MNIIGKSKLAGALTSILGILAAISILAFSRGFEIENVIKLFNDFSETAGALAAAIILVLNGLWMAPVLYSKFAHQTLRSVISGVLAALISTALAVSIGYIIHAFAESEFNEMWIGVMVYTLYSLLLGGIPAGILGGSLGFYLNRMHKKASAMSALDI